MLEIRNPKLNLSKEVSIAGMNEREISKIFSTYSKAGFIVKYKG